MKEKMNLHKFFLQDFSKRMLLILCLVFFVVGFSVGQTAPVKKTPPKVEKKEKLSSSEQVAQMKAKMPRLGASKTRPMSKMVIRKPAPAGTRQFPKKSEK